jgi:hypothetical protein
VNELLSKLLCAAHAVSCPILSCFVGEDETEQLLCIMEIMGAPPRHVIEAASRRKTFFDANNVPVVIPNSRGERCNTSSNDQLYLLLHVQFIFLACDQGI